MDHPVGERDPAYLDVVAAADGVLDGDVLKPLVANLNKAVQSLKHFRSKFTFSRDCMNHNLTTEAQEFTNNLLLKTSSLFVPCNLAKLIS